MVAACTSDYRNPDEGKPVAQGEVRFSLDALEPARAEADARAAISQGDEHLLGVYGYAAEVPGTTDDATSFDVLMIEDTSDYLRDKAHVRFNDRAVAYASAYNRVILAEATAPKTQPRPHSPG